MINKFEVGHWYRFTPKTINESQTKKLWDWCDSMSFILSGVHRVQSAVRAYSDSSYRLIFDDQLDNYQKIWCTDDFEEYNVLAVIDDIEKELDF